MITTTAHSLSLPLSEAKEGGWIPYSQFKGPTASLDFMGCHVSVLSPGCCPHPPYAHIEEELLIILEGEAEIQIAASPHDQHPVKEVLRPGQFSYYPAWQHHTLKNVSSQPVTYLMFKWVAGSNAIATPHLKVGTHDCRALLAEDDTRDFAPRRLFDASTEWLHRFHCHATRLKPGGGYDAHIDAYDVAIVLLSGSIETIGQTIENKGVVYYSAGTLHGMRNPGQDIARYLVFEFETSPRP